MATLRTICDHILDICENAINSGGNTGYLVIIETKNNFKFTISDNGRGMDDLEIKKALDPFYTTKRNRKKKFGVGLSFLKFSVEKTGGTFNIYSKKNKGTNINANFILSNIDCQPVGDITTMILHVLNMSNNFHWKITRFYNKNGYNIDSKFLKENFDLTKPSDLKIIKNYILNLEKEIKEEDK
ncbi:ATP-binding protein [Marinitoga litoralis]|uniref:ATP-binding protein n=1 Tax=Marinitoga litoralis TaxID=570855 RepID=UPI001960003F|nr:ATP-binding protein [Marinitoga litoralis]